jgi:folate-dependent phosphoribosylglycinamide formyltransferase PurN
MKITLFASGCVGLKATLFLHEQNALSFLVLDPENKNGHNKEIITASKLPKNKIFYSKKKYTPNLAPLKNNDFDLIILAWWPYTITSSLLILPLIGTLNFYPNSLPDTSNHSSFSAFVEGAPYKINIHWIDKETKNRTIAFQECIEPTWLDTGYTLQMKAKEMVVELFKKHFNTIVSKKIPSFDQDHLLENTCDTSEFNMVPEIKLQEWIQARKLLNFLRAKTDPLSEGAWFVKNGKKYHIKIKIRQLLYPKENHYEILLEKTYRPEHFLNILYEAQKSSFKGAWFKDENHYYFVNIKIEPSKNQPELLHFAQKAEDAHP